MPILRPTPDLFDLNAWEHYLAELSADPQSDMRDGLIEVAHAHIAALKAPPKNAPLAASSG